MIAVLLIGVLLIAFYAVKAKALTVSGGVAAVCVGGFIALGFGLQGLLLLSLFFFSSTLLGKFKQKQGREEEQIVEKGNCRDAMQVIANGGIPALLAAIYLFVPSELLICGFVASIAAATADTWATEIGSLSKQHPFHVVKWKRVAPGTSGAVTLLGLAAAFAGSFLIVVLAIFLWWGSYYNSHLLLFALIVSGFVGNFFDTIMGASCQVIYHCPTCGRETERSTHCDRPTVHKYGVKWLNNDSVNIICTFTGALLGFISGLLLL